jgi:hypothetical protein
MYYKRDLKKLLNLDIGTIKESEAKTESTLPPQ